ncbi:16S rRNA (cytidine(1402)-2'-O)-methyltransferase [Spiroplasma endosymbiont of Aspidapion aeneum]|uniref:16S rRNA (cytidine(1402)-2'-O)-methyltransferase n=1 Tax=Spiroplasma endosymbiont of Aspidapion aeneum TaxID=3066276 RepID=UPI00313C4FC6
MENIYIQKTYKNNKATIFLLPTPIGNLEDISANFIGVVNEIDLLYCEDTRKTNYLLKYLNIKKPTISFHKFNEQKRKSEIINAIEKNLKIGICSDAGMPGICDPGIFLLNDLLEGEDFNLTIISPGSAFLGSLLISGLYNDYFTFLGFLPKKEQQIERLLKDFANKKSVIVFYESIHRIEKTMLFLKSILSKETRITVVRELTKINEEIVRGKIRYVSDYISSESYVKKGEICVVLDKNICFGNDINISDDYILLELNNIIAKKNNTKDAILYICNKYNKKKNWLYNLYEKQKNK